MHRYLKTIKITDIEEVAMDISFNLMKLTGLAIDTLSKLSKATIRVHDPERIPKAPVVFVVNHFTRMETFFLPNVIYKITGKYLYSLAHYSFFTGSFGRFMEKVGAVSTKDPMRDVKFIGALLRGDMDCIIFPEGQMIKDKRFIERGKYMVYNSGIRRPPHTGAANIALHAQFYREELKSCQIRNACDELNTLMAHFGIHDNELSHVVDQETYIVPVNITYFPIRAHRNIINKIASTFVKSLPERIEEELEVEGTMLVEGVDIDINFGNPIAISPYLKSYLAKRKIKSKNLYLQPQDLQNDMVLRKIAIDIMYRYMHDIYTMTTINHDHIFSYLLTRATNKIKEGDFKTKAYCAIAALKKLELPSCHSALKLKQGYLLTDDPHGRYNDFIDAAKSEGLITVNNGIIYKNKQKFSRAYEFHTIRKDNIVEVLKNEIEPLRNLTRRLQILYWTPMVCVRRSIAQSFYQRDVQIFENDYKHYFKQGETKPKYIGMPFFKKRLFARAGVVLVHGYMAAPAEMRELADFLYNQGYTVYCARLRGHGTSPEDLATRSYDEWYESVNRGYIVVKNLVKKVFICGFSTGAGLALLHAANKKDALCGAVAISAPYKLKNIASGLAPAVDTWNKFLSFLKIKKIGRLDFIPNHPDHPDINYLKNPVSGIHQMETLMDVVEKRLNDIYIPVLIMQGAGDTTVDPRGAFELFMKIPSEKKECTMVHSKSHGITRGDVGIVVARRVGAFLHDYRV
ncbi:MAG TPA: alpha/beta fold hydrolase [Spirochaetota bacterium]|nr:alpha/beta fold hydrolase [Spirochaetota bacterium]